MATRKRKVSKKRTSKKKATPKATMKISGLTFRKEGCSKSKRAAQKKADKIRKAGNKARVITKGGISCVYKGGRRKKRA